MILMVLPLMLTIYNQVNNVNYPKLMDYWNYWNEWSTKIKDGAFQPLRFGIISKLQNIL